MELSENLIRYRKERKLTQEQLAKILNVTVGAISKWENGNNRPDIELLPILADVFQVSIDALLGYEKAYKNLETNIEIMKKMLLNEEYVNVYNLALEFLRRYPNDFSLNKIIADACYSLCFSSNSKHNISEYIELGIYYYEKCIELYDSKKEYYIKEQELHIQVATLLMRKGDIENAMRIIKRNNYSGTYDSLLASCLYQLERRKEAKNMMLHHCVASQIFCLNDFTILADMFEKDNDIETAIQFLETEVKSFEVFMKEEGGYAHRAFAGQAYIIAGLYERLGDIEKKEWWMNNAKYHAYKYNKNPSMEISSMKFCEEVEGRMIDNFSDIIDELLCT